MKLQGCSANRLEVLLVPGKRLQYVAEGCVRTSAGSTEGCGLFLGFSRDRISTWFDGKVVYSKRWAFLFEHGSEDLRRLLGRAVMISRILI